MIEDELRATMRAHDADAPRAAAFDPVVTRDSRLPAVAAAIVMTVALAIGITVFWTRDSTQPAAGANGCPIHYDRSHGPVWVPASPHGLAATGALAPHDQPRDVTICAYQGSLDLTGSRALTGNLAAVTSTLATEPRDQGPTDCEQFVTATDDDNFLIELTFDGATVWIAAPGDHCAGSGNGAFHSSANLSAYVTAAYRTGHWPRIRSTGRLGQEHRLVPDSPASVTIDAYKRRRTVTHGFAPLVSALNAAPTQQSPGECTPSGPGPEYDLTFHYALGTDVRVYVRDHCHPDIDNGSLAIYDSTPFLPMIEGLLNQK